MNVIAGILIVIILLGLLYTYYFFNPVMLNDGNVILFPQKPQYPIGSDQVLDPASLRYFYDGWLRVDSNHDTRNYVMFNQGHEFVVTLNQHKLQLQSSYPSDKKDAVNADGIYDDPKATVVVNITPNFPFQTWVYLCINVDGNTVDTYLNGKLVNSIADVRKVIVPTGTAKSTLDFSQFSYIITANPAPVKVGNATTPGGLAKFRRNPGNIDPQTVWNTYIQGSGQDKSMTGASTDYHTKVSLLRNNKVQRSLTLS
jgi:hypothetical protein